MRTKIQPIIDTRSLLSTDERMLIAQINELSQREHVSILVAFIAVFTITWVHWNLVPAINSMAWPIIMSLVLPIRFFISKKIIYINEINVRLTDWRKLRVFVAALYGIGWGSMLFLLDTGKFDFYFMFKFAAVAAVMGVTVNSLSVLLCVYVGFVAPLFLTVTSFIFTKTSYFNPDDRILLFGGIVVYVSLLLISARKTSELTRVALEQGFERELALSQAKIAEENLRESRENLYLILDSASEGIYGANDKGVCTFVNKSCLQMLGYESEGDLVGKLIHPLIHHTYPDGRPYPMEKCHVRLATLEGKSHMLTTKSTGELTEPAFQWSTVHTRYIATVKLSGQ